MFVNAGRTQCTVGVLHGSPHHNLTITVNKSVGGGPKIPIPFVISDKLQLEVTNTSKTNIVFVDEQPNLNRLDTTQHQTSFSWVVDLENRELYNGPIGAMRAGFRPILTFNVGDLFTHERSHNVLLTQRGIFSDFKVFGFVAVVIGALISLDREDSRAVFKSGETEVFTSEPNTDYEIEIVNETSQHLPIVTDANNYYRAVGGQISEEERIRFMSIRPTGITSIGAPVEPENTGRPGAPAGPEAACFPSFLSMSELQP